jgi:hypothetical protein
MLELAMASTSYNKKPTIFTEHAQDLTDCHRLIMLRPVELAGGLTIKGNRRACATSSKATTRASTEG